jgi:hypothetical protein
MSAFQENVLTETRQNKSGEDKNPPDWGRLNHTSITQADAVSGVSAGADTKVIHGDYGEAVFQDRKTYILGNDVQLLQKNHDETIEGIATVTIKGGRHLMVDVIDDTAVRGARKIWVLGTDTEDYSAHREISEPVQFEMKGLEMGAKGMSIDVKGMSVETTALTVGVEGLKVLVGLFNETNELIEDELKQLCGATKGLDGKLGLLVLHLDPRVNGAPTVSVSAPFGA